MARGPQPVGNTPTLAATDLTDEIRRHLRTLAFVMRKGPGQTVLQGHETRIAETDIEEVRHDVAAALADLRKLKVQLDEQQERRSGARRKATRSQK